jgi:hypothetical protein
VLRAAQRFDDWLHRPSARGIDAVNLGSIDLLTVLNVRRK